MRKRLFAGLLALCMIFNVMPATALAEETAPELVCAGAETEGECAGAETEGECEATEHIEGCAKYETPEVVCDGTENCAAETHKEECAKNVASELVCDGTENCAAETHKEECAKNVASELVCDGTENCLAEEHKEGCLADTKYHPCNVTEGCELAAGHLGDCTGVTSYETEEQYVAEISEEKFTSLEDALTKGGSIKLLSDIKLNAAVSMSNTVELDLNGKTIEGVDSTESNFGLITVNKGGNLTVKDSVGGGKVTVSSTINSGWSRYSAAIANNQGTVTIEGGTIEHCGGTDMAYAIDSLTNGNIGDATLTIKGGTISSPYRAIRQFANSSTHTNKLTVTGGTITGSNKGIWLQSSNENANKGELVISGGEVSSVYIWTPERGNVTGLSLSAKQGLVTNETFVNGLGDSNYVIDLVDDIYQITTRKVAEVNGRKYETLQAAVANATPGATVTLLESVTGSGIVIDKNITIDFNGETYTVENPTVGSTGTETLGFQILKGNTVVLKNGSIEAVSDTAKMLIQNYANLTITDMNLAGTEGVTKYVLSNNNGTVLINGSTNITAPAGAVAFDVYDYQAGGYKGVNVTVDTTGTIKGMVEVSGDGAAPNPVLTVNNGTFVSDKDGFVVEKGEVTINKATVNAGTKNNGSWCAVWANGGTVVINDGTFHTGKDENGKGNDTIYTKNGGKVTIYGGTFSSEVESTSYAKPQYALLNENDANRGTIIVYGGTFVKFDPSNNVSEGANTNFTADGTHTSKNGDEYNVHAYVEATGVGAKADTCTEAGHTGDKVCKTCGTVIEAGTTIDEITGHDFDKETGKCKNGCGAETYVGDVEVVVEPEETEGKVSSSISEDMKETANKIASSVEAAEKTLTEAVKDAAQTYTKDEELIKEAKKALKADANDDITITVKPHLETEIKMITEEKPEEDKPVLTVEINLVYDVVAAKEGDNKEVHLKEVTVSNPGKAIELSFEVSDDIAGMLQELVDAGKKHYIRHPKSNGDVYFHEATLGDNTITFTNDAGFSEFTLMYGDEVPENIIKTSGSSSKKSIATIVETGKYVPTASVSETIIEEGKEELGKLIGDSYGLHKLALAVELEGTLSEKTKVKILVDDVTKSDSIIILQKTEDGWKAVSATAGDGYVIGKFTSLSEILIFVNPDGEIEAAQAAAATAATAQAAGTTPVATGDTANILGYAVIIVAAAMAVLYFRKRRA